MRVQKNVEVYNPETLRSIDLNAYQVLRDYVTCHKQNRPEACIAIQQANPYLDSYFGRAIEALTINPNYTL